MSTITFRTILSDLANSADSNAAKGRSFEQLVQAFIRTDRAQQFRFSNVWLWSDWPGNEGRLDTGVDLVAELRDGGGLVAVQCKFYAEGKRIYKADIDSFLASVNDRRFESGIVVSATGDWSGNALQAITGLSKPVVFRGRIPSRPQPFGGISLTSLNQR